MIRSNYSDQVSSLVQLPVGVCCESSARRSICVIEISGRETKQLTIKLWWQVTSKYAGMVSSYGPAEPSGLGARAGVATGRTSASLVRFTAYGIAREVDIYIGPKSTYIPKWCLLQTVSMLNPCRQPQGQPAGLATLVPPWHQVNPYPLLPSPKKPQQVRFQMNTTWMANPKPSDESLRFEQKQAFFTKAWSLSFLEGSKIQTGFFRPLPADFRPLPSDFRPQFFSKMQKCSSWSLKPEVYLNSYIIWSLKSLHDPETWSCIKHLKYNIQKYSMRHFRPEVWRLDILIPKHINIDPFVFHPRSHKQINDHVRELGVTNNKMVIVSTVCFERYILYMIYSWTVFESQPKFKLQSFQNEIDTGINGLQSWGMFIFLDPLAYRITLLRSDSCSQARPSSSYSMFANMVFTEASGSYQGSRKMLTD